MSSPRARGVTLIFILSLLALSQNIGASEANLEFTPNELRNFEVHRDEEARLTTLAQTRREAEQKHKASIDGYLNQIPISQREFIIQKIEEIHASPRSVVSIQQGKAAPLLLIQGLDLQKRPDEFVKTLGDLSRDDRASYFFKWNKHESLQILKAKLVKELKDLLNRHPGETVNVLAYSAGGSIAHLAFDELVQHQEYARLKLHTIASPIYGYGAPAIATLGAPFAGKTAIEVGRGTIRHASHGQLKNCSHWVTTNCSLDLHACQVAGGFPQSGRSRSTESLPCDEVHTLDNESHSSVVYSVFQSLERQAQTARLSEQKKDQQFQTRNQHDLQEIIDSKLLAGKFNMIGAAKECDQSALQLAQVKP